MKGYESLAIRVLKDFNSDWVGAIVNRDKESEFDELRKFFATENYELFCDLCKIDSKGWQSLLENLKTKACTDNNLYTTLREQHYKQQHNKDFYDDLLMEQGEQG